METLKKIILTIFLLILVTILMYLGIAFIEAEFNPFTWSEQNRTDLIVILFIFYWFIPAAMFIKI